MNLIGLPRKYSIIFFVSVVMIGLFAPQLLTDYTVKGSKYFYSYYSYLWGASIVITAVGFSVLGLISLHLLAADSFIPPVSVPFFCLFIGQVVTTIYILIRSFINQYIVYIPLSLIEFLVLFILLIFISKKKVNYSDLKNNIYKYRWTWIISFALFFILCIALAEHELPRIIMLSSDPDQHAFFAKQIERFGTVPYHQFYWGDLPFGYPSGTGILGYIWSIATGIDVRGTITIQPLLQSYIALFMIVNVICRSEQNKTVVFAIILFVIVLFNYYFTYSLDNLHYHLEKTGTFSSLSLVSFVTCSFLTASNNRIKITNRSLVCLAVIFASVLTYGAVINPINIFYSSVILTLATIMLAGRNVRQWPVLFVLPIALVLFLSLDPYYKNIFTGGTDSVDVAIEQKDLDLSPIEFIQSYKQSFHNTISDLSRFFQFDLLPGKYSYLSFLLLITAFCLYGNINSRILITAILFIAVLMLFWMFFSSLFDTISFATKFRLLKPYFQYSTYQYLYCILFFLLINAALILRKSLQNKKRLIIIFFLLIVALGRFQKNIGIVNKKPRADYANSLVNNDFLVISDIEKYFRLYKSANENDVYPKILLPNILMTIGIENWLIPEGAARILPLYDVFPSAFYYFKGNKEYTYDNYDKYVCKDLNINWLKAQNIQYLFIPTDISYACIYNRDAIKADKEILSNHGEAYFIKLY